MAYKVYRRTRVGTKYLFVLDKICYQEIDAINYFNQIVNDRIQQSFLKNKPISKIAENICWSFSIRNKERDYDFAPEWYELLYFKELNSKKAEELLKEISKVKLKFFDKSKRHYLTKGGYQENER